jgi:hypothetical protein
MRSAASGIRRAVTDDTGGNPINDGGTVDTTTPPTGDGGLAPCLDLPTEPDRPPSGVADDGSWP